MASEKNVTFSRREYDNALADWSLCWDVYQGERAVKAKGETYLPDPNMVEDDAEKGVIYKRYKQRASFYNATGYTIRTLVGSAFRKWPQLTVPPLIEYVEKDVDGEGVSIYQQSQMATIRTASQGRSALFVDYPSTDGAASLADQRSGRLRANILRLDAEQVINWRTEKVGGVHRLALVVFSELVDTETQDGFGLESVNQWRVLRIQEGVYTQELWRLDAHHQPYMHDGPMVPTDGAGNPFQFIPFTFIGASNNDTSIDLPPSLDMARLNIKHYQLAADWYNALFYAGQPQPWISGLDVEWRGWLQEQGFILGSRAMLPLPQGGQFGFATVPAETAIQKEIDNIEQRMVAIGARLIQPGGAVKTATQAQGEQEAQHSVMSLVIENVNEAYTQALGWCLMFMDRAGQSVVVDEINYRISTDLTAAEMNPQLMSAIGQLFQTGKWPESDLFSTMRKLELIDPSKTDDDIREELEGQSLNSIPLDNDIGGQLGQ
jgi:hypothetical protein